MFEIIGIPAFKDNYIWLGVNKQLAQAFVVDPGESAQVLEYLKTHHLTLIAILLTHKHADHTGGVKTLMNVYPDLAIYAHPDEKLPFITNPVKDEDKFLLAGWKESFHVLHIPGHTLGHVAYYMKPVVFSGDTLFGAGCGRIFEGTAEQMFSSLSKLAALPEDTLIYCGHEYTLANLNFAHVVEPNNTDIAARIKMTEQLRAELKPSLPSVMSDEFKTNPFLRCTQECVIASVENIAQRKLANKVEVFFELREWKNSF